MNTPVFEIALMFLVAAGVAFLFMVAGQIDNPLFWGMVFSLSLPLAFFLTYLYRNGH